MRTIHAPEVWATLCRYHHVIRAWRERYWDPLMSITSIGTSAPNAPTLGEDFPIVCDACLGPNPYTRMIKSDMAKECKISGSPFTAFRWQGALRRWKETLICATVAREKNWCAAVSTRQHAHRSPAEPPTHR
jgi:hypothetical protein